MGKETDLNREDWEKSKYENESLIVNNKLQIEMAQEVIKLCEKKIKSFPKPKKSINQI